ncbi:MAG: hypothetical protein PUF50_06760 [Erysipelotrichaceae bacterium]|nr:hypothetical protein [Erysipelotrichaceae bacterium]
MKQTVQAYLLSLISILLLAILVSLIIGILFFFQLVSTPFIDILLWILGIVVFAIGGMIFGYYLQKRILIQALLLSTLIFITSLLFTPFQWLHFLYQICKWCAFIVGTILIQLIKKDN